MTATTPISPEEFLAGESFKMLIGDEFVGLGEHSGGALETLDPSTGEPIATVPEATPRTSTAPSRPLAPRTGLAGARLFGRAKCFARFAELLVEHRERLALLDAIDGGNPLRAMRIDVDICLEYLKVYPSLAWGLHGRVIDASKNGLHYTKTTPYGVVGRILAFNHPMMFAVTRPLPALIIGNTMVMKPAPQTPLSTLALGELFAEAFPPASSTSSRAGSRPATRSSAIPT